MYPGYVMNFDRQTDLPNCFMEEIKGLKSEVEQKKIGIHIIQGSDRHTKFYTGLRESFFKIYLQPASLSLKEEILMFLVCLRLGLLEDLAACSITVASNSFQKFLELMFVVFAFLVSDRQEIS